MDDRVEINTCLWQHECKKNIHVCDFVLASFVFREYYHLCEFTVTRDKTGVTAFCHRTKTKKDLINEWPAFVCFTQRNAYTEQTTEYVPRRSTGPLMWLSIASCVEPERERGHQTTVRFIMGIFMALSAGCECKKKHKCRQFIVACYLLSWSLDYCMLSVFY